MDAQSVDLARLIAIIADEVMAAVAAAGRARAPATRVPEDCCPTRLQGVIDAGAARLGMHATGGAADRRGRAHRPHAAQTRRDAAGRRAAVPGSRGVHVRDGLRQSRLGRALRARLLRATPVGVCAVVGFPLGATTPDVKHFETRRVIFDGAREVDMVINIGALKSGDLRAVERDIEAVTGPCRDCRVDEQGHHRGGLSHRRGEGHRLHAREGRLARTSSRRPPDSARAAPRSPTSRSCAASSATTWA